MAELAIPRKVIVLRVVVAAECVEDCRNHVTDLVSLYDTLDSEVRDLTTEETEDYLSIYGEDYMG